jgi:spermidine/putrescine transport system substrate-binding protein
MNPIKKIKRAFILIIIIFTTLLTIFFYTRERDNEKTLYLFNWSTYTPESVIEEFEKEYDVKVSVDNYSSNEELFAKLLSGATGYDVIFPSQDYVSIMIKEHMLEKLDLTQIPNSKYISDLAKEKMTYDPAMEYSVPYFMGAAGVGVNKTKLSSYEKSWNIFARKDLAGSMVMMDNMRDVLGDALAENGYSVNSTNKKELLAAQKTIENDWKPNLVKFDTDGFGKAFASGDFAVVQGYAEVIYGEIPEEDWHNIDFFIPKEGGAMYIDSMCIPKGAQHYDLALKFINFIHRPEIYAQFLDAFNLPPTVNEAASALMTTESFYSAADIKNAEPMNDLGEHLSDYIKIWEKIRFTK